MIIHFAYELNKTVISAKEINMLTLYNPVVKHSNIS